MSLELDPDDAIPRRPHEGGPGGSGAKPLRIVLGLAVLGVVFWVGYSYATRDPLPQDGDVPLITAEPGPIRRAPEDPGGREVPGRDRQIYRILDGTQQAEAENILPGPEPVAPMPDPLPLPPPAPGSEALPQPAPVVTAPPSGLPAPPPPAAARPDAAARRPNVPPPPVALPEEPAPAPAPAPVQAPEGATADQAPAVPPPAAPALAAPPPAAAEAAPPAGIPGLPPGTNTTPPAADAAATEPAPARPAPRPPAPRPTPPPEVAAETPTPAANAPAAPAPAAPAPAQQSAAVSAPAPQSTGSADGVMVQLAALRDVDAAKASWARLQRAHPDLLGRYGSIIEPVTVGGNRLYRLRVGMLPSRAAAERLCADLKARSLDCAVVR